MNLHSTTSNNQTAQQQHQQQHHHHHHHHASAATPTATTNDGLLPFASSVGESVIVANNAQQTSPSTTASASASSHQSSHDGPAGIASAVANAGHNDGGAGADRAGSASAPGSPRKRAKTTPARQSRQGSTAGTPSRLHVTASVSQQQQQQSQTKGGASTTPRSSKRRSSAQKATGASDPGFTTLDAHTHLWAGFNFLRRSKGRDVKGSHVMTMFERAINLRAITPVRAPPSSSAGPLFGGEGGFVSVSMSVCVCVRACACGCGCICVCVRHSLKYSFPCLCFPRVLWHATPPNVATTVGLTLKTPFCQDTSLYKACGAWMAVDATGEHLKARSGTNGYWFRCTQSHFGFVSAGWLFFSFSLPRDTCCFRANDCGLCCLLLFFTSVACCPSSSSSSPFPSPFPCQREIRAHAADFDASSPSNTTPIGLWHSRQARPCSRHGKRRHM